jgi:hypothetical protein
MDASNQVGRDTPSNRRAVTLPGFMEEAGEIILAGQEDITMLARGISENGK